MAKNDEKFMKLKIENNQDLFIFCSKRLQNDPKFVLNLNSPLMYVREFDINFWIKGLSINRDLSLQKLLKMDIYSNIDIISRILEHDIRVLVEFPKFKFESDEEGRRNVKLLMEKSIRYGRRQKGIMNDLEGFISFLFMYDSRNQKYLDSKTKKKLISFIRGMYIELTPNLNLFDIKFKFK